MIQNYVNKLIENLPDDIKNNKSTLNIDLVLDGGAFNGSYQIGALCFLKEMENRKYIKIKRLSGCSVGSIVALFYFLNKLDLFEHVYQICYHNLKTNYNLQTLKDLKNILKEYMPHDFYKKINNNLYITFYNVTKREKVIKKTYKNNDDIINTIIKSSFIPIIIDGNLLYKNSFVDGINPYIFKIKPNRKILYLDLFGLDKISNLLNVKNESNNFHRILSGLLDIHNFYIKQSNTNMCSYVNEWTLTNHVSYIIKYAIEKICIYIIYLLIYIKNTIPFSLYNSIQESIMYKLILKIVKELYILMIDKYCLH